MSSPYIQRGVGLIEVLVALLLLAIGVLGYSALQLRANGAAIEANDRTIAMNIARDLAERMRINRTAFETYKAAINTKTQTTTCYATPTANYVPGCNENQMARADAWEIHQKAEAYGHTIKLNTCKGSSIHCIYIAWGKTDISSNLDTCVSSTGTYVPNSQCLVMEAF